MMSKFFATKYIGDMNLNHGSGYAADGIEDGNGRVSICTGVKDNAVSIESHFLYFVDNCSLTVALEIVYAAIGVEITQTMEVIVKTFLTIDFRLANTQKIQIWAIDNLYSHSCKMIYDANIRKKVLWCYAYDGKILYFCGK